MKIYTKTGDRGETSLLSGERVPKDHLRVEAYGALDEVGATLGLAKSLVRVSRVGEIIQELQERLFDVSADLSLTHESEKRRYKIREEHVAKLEQLIDTLERERGAAVRFSFVVSGGTTASAVLDLARTMVRRSERWLVKLQREEPVPPPVALYLNRLSDLLFSLARYNEREELVKEITGQVLQKLRQSCPAEEVKTRMLEKAKKMIAAAEKKALEIGVPMVIAVVDAGGNLVAVERMDDALLASISIAQDKAYTAVALKMPTQTAAGVTQPGTPLYGLNTTNNGRMVIFGGGLPIMEHGKAIGAIGVSGGAVEEDVCVAEAGLAAWK
ncbi:MAG TPA: cob(I)yrinic acid a,c-diamide adenosyltransferase [Patescibacteria group bacterium]|nr:cob(I)yrinic acid a,c-diamide adenosyltransferase [Patescibacteria group bacterium]